MAEPKADWQWLDPVADPAQLFADWFKQAETTEPNDPNAMALATVGADGMPSVRIVLLKAYDAEGFTFFTNYQSRKADELGEHKLAALCLHWKSLLRQIRIEGTVEPVPPAISDAYFTQRPRQSQLGAWASLQSRPLPDRSLFTARLAEYEARYPDTVPRPPHWGGYRLRPAHIEFWQQYDYRLHDRVLFSRKTDGGWTGQRLFP